ncbi:MAG: saccharopine dehydrogenase NADP-binding domain-containing protein [Deltaproteobacteria bacterium]|nr:saccharopine dehydrogenase NADP-binding domain-containing protein [Deltaproteobacteria bacterium]
MKFLVIGSGMQGQAAAYDLIRNPQVGRVVLADASRDRVEKTKRWLNSDKICTAVLSASDCNAVAQAATGMDVVVGAVPYELNFNIANACIAAKASFVDLGGETSVALKELELDSDAKAAGVTIIPDCGVGPGLTNVAAAYGIERLDIVDSVEIRDGGLPQRPKPPLNYLIVFSFDVVLNEYSGTTYAVRDFKRVEVEALSEVEEITLPEPFGRCEAAHGASMLSTLPWSYKNKVRNMDTKIIRYPGHFAFMKILRDAGFLNKQPVNVSGLQIIPWDITREILRQSLETTDREDLYYMKVTVTGSQAQQRKQIVLEVLDLYDKKTEMTAMARGTAFTASIVAQMIGSGVIKAKGAFASELAVPPLALFDELRKRNIVVNIREQIA